MVQFGVTAAAVTTSWQAFTRRTPALAGFGTAPNETPTGFGASHSHDDTAHQAALELRLAHERFNRSTRHLTEEMSGFSPAVEAMTTSQHVAHCAKVVDWFIEGAFRPQGFDMDFESQIGKVRAVHSLAEARAWFNRSMNTAIAFLGARSDAELSATIADGPVLGGQATFAIVSAIVDHTAHHRGALTVYARTNGITPPDPYIE